MKSNQFSKQLRLKVIQSLMALLWKKSAKKCILCSFIFKIVLLLWTHLQDITQPSGGCFHWLSWEQKMLSHLPALSPCRLGSCPVNEKSPKQRFACTNVICPTQRVCLLPHVSQLYVFALHCFGKVLSISPTLNLGQVILPAVAFW